MPCKDSNLSRKKTNFAIKISKHEKKTIHNPRIGGLVSTSLWRRTERGQHRQYAERSPFGIDQL